MMAALLVLKTRVSVFFERHYRVLRILIKVLAFLGIFALIFFNFPYQPVLQEYRIPAILVMAAVCGFLPDMLGISLAAVLTAYEVSAVSAVAAISFFVILVVYFLLFGRYAKNQSYLVILIPALWQFQLAYAVPVVAALFLSPAMIPACITGVFIRFLLNGIKDYYIISQTAVDTGNTMEGLQYIFDYVAQSKEMVIYMLTFALTYLLVYIIRRAKFNYASQIAIFIGIVTCMAGMIAGDLIWSVQMQVSLLVTGLVMTAALAYVVQFFRMNLDYHGVTNLQFQDDDYYYYVKAVPKLKVAAVEKTVTRIGSDREDSMKDLRDEIEKVLGEDIKDRS